MKTTYPHLRGALVLALVTGSVSAWAQTVNPNGFPNGPHYNLNIIGKKADYNCAPAQPDPITGLYGNVVFIPEFGLDRLDGQIVIKSGRKGGKASTLYTVLQVPDSCSPGFDGDPAEVELPPNEKGYWVYARALAKPGGAATLTYNGALFSAFDEYGNDLVYLGLVTSYGVALPEQGLVRSKGKSVAVDITGMFLWSGTVCNINFTSGSYLTSDPMDPNYRPVCWTDNPAQPDGLVTPDDIFAKALTNPDGTLLAVPCAEGSTLIWVPVTCTEYTNEWIFNIAELVSSDWLVLNEGSKLIQIRFYPVP